MESAREACLRMGHKCWGIFDDKCDTVNLMLVDGYIDVDESDVTSSQASQPVSCKHGQLNQAQIDGSNPTYDSSHVALAVGAMLSREADKDRLLHAERTVGLFQALAPPRDAAGGRVEGGCRAFADHARSPWAEYETEVRQYRDAICRRRSVGRSKGIQHERLRRPMSANHAAVTARFLPKLDEEQRKAAGAALGIATLAGVGGLLWRWRSQRARTLNRPFILKDLTNGETVEDPLAELTRVVTWLQDEIIRPLDARLPGKPFEHDLLAFPFTPMVLVVGNHSAGKSTFINRLLGTSVQETGVAPTDDGFTVLQRHPSGNEVEDGPTLLSCPENRPFKELQRFGQPFWGHFRRKKLKLPQDSMMPYGLQIVDTPGMIDMPVKSESMAGGRGYNFLEVVRWFAKRADLILLLFDPDRPGTTGESLDVLTRSMAGLDHKFVIILNKVDQLDSSVDFARAYGTLGWALSKVIPRKDIPQIYTMYNSGVEHAENGMREHKLPLEAFRQKREEVVQEVLRARTRHWDNVITATEDGLEPGLRNSGWLHNCHHK
ncbi:EHD2 [Symbiodinium pilosum]|uniref:EHD2 protein n=1 Tax=Symbiodinium pilosum TaxID=2952 RepID=A0A812PCA7_SYMPI|nr:EHD2 [Symbiodinium pilosum]